MNRTIPTSIKIRKSEELILETKGFSIEQCIGEGSYSKVYQAQFCIKQGETVTKRKLACKVIDGARTPSDFLRKFFPRELDILTKLDYIYCVKIHSVLQKKHRFYLFMELCENGDLLDFIRKYGPVKEKLARLWCTQILKGLNYLQENSIVHRDLKCENILLNNSYNVKICDYGFSKYILQGDAYSDTYCGSIAYAAPEVIRGNTYDPEFVDTWSAGVILFVMINKSLPFDDTNLKTLYDDQTHKRWKLKPKVDKRVSNQLKNFLSVLLEPNPKQRFPISLLLEHPWIQIDSLVSKANSDYYGLFPYVINGQRTLENDENMSTLYTNESESLLASKTIRGDADQPSTSEPEPDGDDLERTESLLEIHKSLNFGSSGSKHTFFMDQIHDTSKMSILAGAVMSMTGSKMSILKGSNSVKRMNIRSLVKNVAFKKHNKGHHNHDHKKHQ